MSYDFCASPVKVPPSGPESARIMFIGEAPGRDEVNATTPQPFVGSSGAELSALLAEVQLVRRDCFLTNVARYRPIRNEIDYFWDKCTKVNKIPGPVLVDGMKELFDEIERVDPEVIVPLGNTSLWAVTGGLWGITSWRGSQLYSDIPNQSRKRKVIPTFHPAYVQRVWRARHDVLHDLRRMQRHLGKPDWPADVRNIIVDPTFSESVQFLEHILEELNRGPTIIAHDLETIKRSVSCSGLGITSREAICIPFMGPPTGDSHWNRGQELRLVSLHRRVLTHPNARVVGQNYLYDTQHIINEWFCVPKTYLDTMVAFHTCFPGEPKGLDYLSSIFCEKHVYWKDDVDDYNVFPDDPITYWTYNGKDVCTTYEIVEPLESMVRDLGFIDQCAFQHRMCEHAFKTMNRGVRIDTELRQQMSLDMYEVFTEHEKLFEQILPVSEFRPMKSKNASPWYKSSKQLCILFYDELGLKVQKDKKTGSRSSRDDALEALKLDAPELTTLFQLIQEYRSVGVFKENFIDSPLDPDKRMRCSYKVAGPETFRFASAKSAFGTGTNLQAISKGNKLEDAA